ncbi:CxC2 domain-containing protein [Favolaschia claudopus]|uniref:CxC2 domain-containing protein n=1 Tax=Favolaschia claudopus TaxID=2862362 RepID=A0AAW0AAK8_9AGAR
MIRNHALYIEDDEINDGSDSDDDEPGYVPRANASRIHYVPDESTSFSTNGNRRTTTSNVATPASPSKKTRISLNQPEPVQPSLQDWDADFSEFDADEHPRSLRESDDPHGQWARLDREAFLDELLRLDGRGDFMEQASCSGLNCNTADPMFRCSDCLHPCLYCKDCVKELHLRTPFHHIEMWNGTSFQRCSLKSLGVRIQLGHPPGELCGNPSKAAGDDFVIITSQTIDELRCCPANPTPPNAVVSGHQHKPAFCGNVLSLRRFAHMTLESKCSPYEFYNSLARETNNTGLEPSRDRYDEFTRMTRQWQHLLLLKRAGRGHDPSDNRVESTKAGELALLCPACFYTPYFLAIDANFRLKRKDVSSETKDPGLVRGWGFYGEVTRYMQHLAANWDEPQERSTCVAHDAVDKPDRESLGTASSGIGTVDCARHNMKRPNGVGDLQRGERYLNMDYMFFMSLLGCMLGLLFVSYDIACQWSKKFWKRMEIFPPNAQFTPEEKRVVFLVPKFHLPAHIESCNISYSFNLTRFVGRTDGEAPERGWSDINRLASSTSVSGPGARRDTLEVHMQYWNWKKIVRLGHTLLQRIKKYVPLMLETRAAWVDVEASFPYSVIAQWTAMAEAWEADSTKPNPFATTIRRDDLKDVRRRLAVVASRDINSLRVRGDMHETEMLSMGLQLEDQQRIFARNLKHVGAHETVDQGTKRIERETKLRRKIDAWMAVQQLFIPEVAVLRDRENTERKRISATQALPGIRADQMKLWLPSAIGTRASCDESLRDYEYQLRKGQAAGALEEMRNQLLLRTHEYRAKTRSATRAKEIDERIVTDAADEYRAAHAALVSLGALLKRSEWQKDFKPLRQEDIRGRPSAVFGDDERRGGDPVNEPWRAQQRTEAKMPMSWIWLSEGSTGDEKDVVHNEALRIEWAKTRAKAMRYAEEVDLLEEEMRRVLQYLAWRTSWWKSLVGLRADKQGIEVEEGHAAYAHKQASYMEGIRARFEAQWGGVGMLLDQARTLYASMSADDGDVRYDISEHTA